MEKLLKCHHLLENSLLFEGLSGRVGLSNYTRKES